MNYFFLPPFLALFAVALPWFCLDCFPPADPFLPLFADLDIFLVFDIPFIYGIISLVLIYFFMTEQQEHLANLLQQRQQLSQELETLQGQATVKRELFFKVQGVIEYLTQIGVVLPEPEPVEEVSEDA